MSTFDLDAIRASDDRGPVTMLNLIKYRPQATDGSGSGREAYTRYTDVVGNLVSERGGKVLWAGVMAEAALNDGHSDTDWDYGLVVYYPSREAFLDMVTSDEYLKANEDRLAGIEKHIIVASKTIVLDSLPG